MDLHRLETFAAIGELGNLSKAAVALQTLPSVVSRRLAALERDWGGRLFHRTGRGMTLTELGARVLPGVRATLLSYESVRAAIRSEEGVLGGEVRIGLVPSLAQAIAAQLFRDVRLHYPGIRLQLLEGVTAQLDQWRLNDEVDLTVLFRAGSTELHNEECLGEIETYLVGGLGDPVTAAPVTPFRKLEGLPLVLASMPNGLRADVEKEARRQGLSLNVVLATNSLAVQTELAARGGAYTIMAGNAASQCMEAGLQASRIIEPGILRKVVLSLASHRPADAAARLIARQTRLHVEQSLSGITLTDDDAVSPA